MGFHDELDTPLARLLHARGRLPLEVLREALDGVRAARGKDDRSLAQTLVERGLLAADEARALVAEASGPAGWRAGSVIAGRYRIERRLGQGGMGAVDEVTDLTTGARRALKSLSSASSPELRVRFLREGEALARVDRHPAVVRVHAAGEDEGRLWLLMDLEVGGDLARRLTPGPLPVDDVVRLGVALASGLAHVHRRGVLHRDLKPQNVLFDAAGGPKLTDFGLARTADARSLTQTGELLGTPAYMAPEQAMGDVSGQDERTDVYGLGALLYHALTGRPPFDGGSAIAILSQVVDGDFARPRALRPDAPAWLERALLRAMARRPADRFASAAALREALLDQGRADAARGRRRVLASLVAAPLVALVGVATLAAIRRTGPAEDAVASPDPQARVRPDAAPVTSPVAPAPPVPVTAEVALERARAAAAITARPPSWLGTRPSDDPVGLAWMAWEHAGKGGQNPGELMLLAEFLAFDGTGRALAPEAAGAGVAWLARLIDAPWAAPVHASTWALLARAHRQGVAVPADDAAALVCFERAAELGSLSALELLARASWRGVFYQRRDPARAFALAERGLAADVDDRGEWLSCAELQARALLEHPSLRTPDRVRLARERLERALVEETDARRHPEARLGLAWLLEVEGKPQDALATLQQVVHASTDPEVRAAALLRWWHLAGDDTGASAALVRLAHEEREATPPDDRPFALALGRVAASGDDAPAAARWLLAAAALDDPGAGRETELLARLELGRLARRELEGGRPAFELDRVRAALGLVVRAGSREAEELAAWLDRHLAAGPTHDEVLRRLEAQVGPLPEQPPSWLGSAQRLGWPTEEHPALGDMTLSTADALLARAPEGGLRREAWAMGLALLARVVRAAPERATRGRAWAMLARATVAERGVVKDEPAALVCLQAAAALGSVHGIEELARAHCWGFFGLPKDPARAYDMADALLEATPHPRADDEGAWVGCVRVMAEAIQQAPALQTAERLARTHQRLVTAMDRSVGDRDVRLRRYLASIEELERARR